MAKRDSQRIARNKAIEAMKVELRALLPDVLRETGLRDESSLNAKIGNKTDYVVNLLDDVIVSPDHFVALWMDGFKKQIANGGPGAFRDLFAMAKASPALKKYLNLFLRRSYLKHYDELYKKRPIVEEAEIWIGENHANYGLLVTPRFANGDWENDKSEIRHFRPRYWTIEHVLQTGLVVPGKDSTMPFPDVEGYLNFFENVLVRGTASPHQKAIAERYCAFVRNSEEPLDVLLLIPELRYNGRVAKHEHRLDFCVIDPGTMDKTGFELSPWSTHGKLSIKGKTSKQVNEVAKANFEREAKKLKNFFQKHGVYTLIYTDSALADPDEVFEDIKTYLVPTAPAKQLSFHLIDDFFK